MRVFLNYNYGADVQYDLLGYIGENNSRKIVLENYETDGADLYKLILSYPDNVQYEVDISSGEYTVPASLLRAPGDVSMQVIAVRSSDGAYIKKSSVFTGEIKPSVSGETEPIPPYEDAADALDKVLAAVKSAESSAAVSEQNAQSANAAKTAAETARIAAESAATSAEESYKGAEQAAQNAAESAQTAAESADNTKQSEQVVLSVKSEIDSTAETVSATAQTVSQNAAAVLQSTAIAENAMNVAVEKSQEIADNAAQIQQNAADIAELKSDVSFVQDILSSVAVESWADVQKIVRAGQAAKYFSVGDQFVCEKTKLDGTVEKLVWDVIGIDQDTLIDTQFTHSLTLQTHDCYASMQFDAREALFAFPDGLTAGTYNFTVGAQPWYADDVGKTFTFTLTQAIPAGGQLVVNSIYTSTMVGATISAFASGAATTAIETVTMTIGSAGADLGTVTAAVNDNTNSIQRALLGSNNWRESAMRQWLNSDAAAGSVWIPKTKFDRPPSWAANTEGFLRGLDPEFVNVLGSVKKTTALNNVSDGGGSEINAEKMFLLSRSEIYAGNEIADGEGEPYAYYKNLSDLTAAGTGADVNRIKYHEGAACSWWLRTNYISYAYGVRSVNPSGICSSRGVTNSLGVAPACCIV